MLAVTHLIVALLLIQLLVLDRNDAFVALLFGVFIDVDHLLGLKQYADSHGFRAMFSLDSLMNPGGQWKSMLHSPIAAAVVGPLSIVSRLAIPLLFWSVHIGMDFLEDTFFGVLSSEEAVFALLAGSALVSLRYSRCLETNGAGTLVQYFLQELRKIRHMTRSSA